MPAAARVLMLTPSHGLGGGIERYAETLEAVFSSRGIGYSRVDLTGSGVGAHARLLARSGELLRNARPPTRIVLLHKSLLPVGALLARDPRVSGISVLCHGTDVWIRQPARGWAEGLLLRRAGVRAIAVSGYTAGALVRLRGAGVLPPGLAPEWFATLARAGAHAERGPEVRLMTAFRLRDWRDKGLPELVTAVTALGRGDIRLTVCGSGEPPAGLRKTVRDHDWCTLLPGLPDGDLAREYAAADLFILATRTRAAAVPAGEGFGMALLEAQIAGTPVVAPAYGGSSDAYVEGMTGAAPADESSQALTDVLRRLLADRARLAGMGTAAARWTQECFAPERYADLAITKLL